MKTIIFGLIFSAIAVLAQVYFIGINGLTIISIPTTIFLGFEIVERLTETEQTDSATNK